MKFSYLALFALALAQTEAIQLQHVEQHLKTTRVQAMTNIEIA